MCILQFKNGLKKFLTSAYQKTSLRQWIGKPHNGEKHSQYIRHKNQLTRLLKHSATGSFEKTSSAMHPRTPVWNCSMAQQKEVQNSDKALALMIFGPGPASSSTTCWNLVWAPPWCRFLHQDERAYVAIPQNGKLKYWEMMDKDYLSFYASLGPPIHSTFSGRRGIPLLEMTFPVYVWPPKQALLLIHCYYTTLQVSSENCPMRFAHIENWANCHNFKWSPLTRRGNKWWRLKQKQNQRSDGLVDKLMVWQKFWFQKLPKACYILVFQPSLTSI